jgi:hypothetical protein
MSSQTHTLEDLRYPIGCFAPPERVSAEDRIRAIATLAELPGKLRNALNGLDQHQLDTPYRDGGWTVRQAVHHVADSHMNATLRVRMALTEDWPTVLPYDEGGWAMLPDYAAPVEWSVGIAENVHARWVLLLQSLTKEQWQRGFNHPKMGSMTIEVATMLYAWHSLHHIAHITNLRAREGW